MFLMFLLLMVNFGISWLNASGAGRFWSERHDLPGYARAMMWMAAIMSVCGFFMVYGIILTMILHDTGGFMFIGMLIGLDVTPEEVELLTQSILNTVYLIIVFPVIGIGFAAWANSVAVFIQRRDLGSGAVAAWNTGAQIHNVVSAVRHVPQASSELWKGLGKLFSGKKSGQLIGYAILFGFPLIISLGSAIFTTVVIMRASDAKWDLDHVAATS